MGPGPKRPLAVFNYICGFLDHYNNYNSLGKNKRVLRIPTEKWKSLEQTPVPRSGRDSYHLHHVPFGYCIIINNNFRDSKEKYREGAAEDVKKLKTQFERRNFKPQVLQDLTRDQMLRAMADLVSYCDKDKGKISCVVVAIMSHGDCERLEDHQDDEDTSQSGQGVIISSDSKRVKVDEILENFYQPNSTLAGIPKLFILHACRGKKKDRLGVLMDPDEPEGDPALPLMADYLLAFPTALHYVAYRNPTEGANFIQKLCDTLGDKDYDNEDFYIIFTEVARKVAELKLKKEKKEMPNFTSFLRHKLVLPPLPPRE